MSDAALKFNQPKCAAQLFENVAAPRPESCHSMHKSLHKITKKITRAVYAHSEYLLLYKKVSVSKGIFSFYNCEVLDLYRITASARHASLLLSIKPKLFKRLKY